MDTLDLLWHYWLTGCVMIMATGLIANVWRWLVGVHPGPHERIRTTALRLAIDSHGQARGEPHDSCFTARARVFEHYLKEGKK